MEPLSKYWPTIVGVFLVTLLGTLLWPKEPQALAVSSPPVYPGGQRPQPEVASVADKDEDEEKRLVPLPPKPRIVVEELTIPVLQPGEKSRTLRPEDQDVQAALSSVEIDLYKADWCSQCAKTEEFFEQNQLKFRSHDVESDAMVKEKARRLSGQTGIPVIVIDGEVIVGFSEPVLSKRLSSAVERRVLGSKN